MLRSTATDLISSSGRSSQSQRSSPRARQASASSARHAASGGQIEASRSAALRDPLALGRLTDEVRRAYLLEYAKLWENYIADIRMLPMVMSI